MQKIQYDRQKRYYKWALILGILGLLGYTVYFGYIRYSAGINIFTDNISLYIRLILIIYFSSLFIYLPKIPKKIFNKLGFLIMIPLGWCVSLISYLTVGYDGITVTGFIFLILYSSIMFNFTVLSFSIALFLLLSFHFALLTFYPTDQPEGLFNHIFLLGLSSILGFATSYVINIIKNNEGKALKESELLLKEIHHRVKNNLQIVSSLLNLQSGSISDEYTKTVVKEGQSRVKSIALIHQLLYQTEMITSVYFSDYLEQLMASLHNTFKNPGKNIMYFVHAEKLKLDIDTAVPLGLITNELATNAYKYAFADKNEGRIEIDFRQTEDKHFILIVKDNGKGFPDEINIEEIQTLGLKLVKILARQIKADLDYKTRNGTEFKLTFSQHKRV